MKLTKTITCTILVVLFCWTHAKLDGQVLADSEIVARLKANRSLFQDLDQGVDLLEKARTSNKDVNIERGVMGTPSMCANCPEPNANDDPDVKRAAQVSNLVVTGTVVRNISALTAKHRFTFTDSQFVIGKVLKNSTSVKAGDEITIVQPGGTVIQEGHKIRTAVSDVVPLTKNHLYLLFLRYVPASRSYVPVALGGFDLTTPIVTSIRPLERFPAGSFAKDGVGFLAALQNSVSRAGEGQ